MILCLLATFALCGGMVLNQFRETPLPLVYQSKAARLRDSVRRIASQQVVPAPTPASRQSERLGLEEFSSYVKNKQGLILDARPELFHRLGHVPGALSLPRDDFEKAYAGLKGSKHSVNPGWVHSQRMERKFLWMG